MIILLNFYDNIIIFEDDIILHKDFHNIFKKNLTENIFDIFILGASDFSFNRLNSSHLDIDKSIYKPDYNTKFLCGTYSNFYSNFAIKTDGTLWVWGYGYLGQLGVNSTANISSPVQTITGGTNWKQASAFTYLAGAVKTDGTLWAWGYNGFGELGQNNRINL